MSSGLVMIRFVGGPIESTSQSVGTIAVGTAQAVNFTAGKGLSKLILSATLGAETLCQGWLIRGEAFRGSARGLCSRLAARMLQAVSQPTLQSACKALCIQSLTRACMSSVGVCAGEV